MIVAPSLTLALVPAVTAQHYYYINMNDFNNLHCTIYRNLQYIASLNNTTQILYTINIVYNDNIIYNNSVRFDHYNHTTELLNHMMVIVVLREMGNRTTQNLSSPFYTNE